MFYQGILLAVLGVVTAQTTTGISANQTISAPVAYNGSTVPSPTSPVVQLNLNLEDLWDLLIGPVEVAETTTTVSPTPVPSQSLIPPPPLYYSPFPTGQQIPLAAKNESWSFPEDFWYVTIPKPMLHSLTLVQVGSCGCRFPDRRRSKRRRSRS